MSNQTYLASRRAGGRGSCAPDKRRVSVTLSEETFLALQARADRAHRGLSGEVAEILTRELGGDRP
jgi:hypothetical protein